MEQYVAVEKPRVVASGAIEGRRLRVLVWDDRLELRDRGLLPIFQKSQFGRGRTIAFNEIDGAAVNGTALRIGMGPDILDITMDRDDVVAIAGLIHRFQSGGRAVPPFHGGGPTPRP
jgi:hypothetical protein